MPNTAISPLEASKSLAFAVDKYSSAMQAHREFLARVSTALTALRESSPSEVDHVSTIVGEEFAKLPRGEWDQFAQTIRIIDEKVKGLLAEKIEGVVPIPGVHAFTPNGWEVMRAFARRLKTYVPMDRHKHLLYRSVLTGLVSQFEVLLADVLRVHYRLHPRSLGERTLTAADLGEFESIADAFTFLIASEVERTLRGSVKDWKKELDRFGVDLSQLAPDWDRFCEIIQRRHVIVHADCRVTRSYLDNVSPVVIGELLGSRSVGLAIAIEEPYMEQTVESIEATGLALAFIAWQKLVPTEPGQLYSLLDETIDQAMAEQRWSTAMHLCNWAKKDKTTFSQSFRLTCEVNSWLCYKMLGRFCEVERTVSAFDHSGLLPRYAIARAVLLEDLEQALYFVEVAGSTLTLYEWNTWPMLNDIRNHPQFLRARERTLGASDGRSDPQ